MMLSFSLSSPLGGDSVIITRSLSDLMLAVQQAGAWENSEDITPAVLLRAINYGLVTGYDAMVAKWEDYYTIDATFPIVAGTSSYTLSTIAPNFYKLRHLDVSDDGARYHRCYPHDLSVAHRYTSQATSARRFRYRLQAGNLTLVPVPQNGTGHIFWIPLPVQFSSVDDTMTIKFDVPVEEQLIVHLAERFCLRRSDLPLDSINQQIAEDTAQLRTAADARDAGEPFYLDPNGPRSRRGGWFDGEEC